MITINTAQIDDVLKRNAAEIRYSILITSFGPFITSVLPALDIIRSVLDGKIKPEEFFENIGSLENLATYIESNVELLEQNTVRSREEIISETLEKIKKHNETLDKPISEEKIANDIENLRTIYIGAEKRFIDLVFELRETFLLSYRQVVLQNEELYKTSYEKYLLVGKLAETETVGEA